MSRTSATLARLVSARRRSPCMAASTCRALAVFPLDASIRICFRSMISPRSSLIMPQAILSFTEPNGLQYSSFAYRSMPSISCRAGSSRSSGVFPISSVMCW